MTRRFSRLVFVFAMGVPPRSTLTAIPLEPKTFALFSLQTLSPRAAFYGDELGHQPLVTVDRYWTREEIAYRLANSLPLIPFDFIPYVQPMETPTGMIDFSRLNNVFLYTGQAATFELCRDVEIAQEIGLLRYTFARKEISPQTFPLLIRKFNPNVTLHTRSVGWQLGLQLIHDAHRFYTEQMWQLKKGHQLRWEHNSKGSTTFYLDGQELEDSNDAQILFLLSNPNVSHLRNSLSALPAEWIEKWDWTLIDLPQRLAVRLRSVAIILYKNMRPLMLVSGQNKTPIRFDDRIGFLLENERIPPRMMMGILFAGLGIDGAMAIKGFQALPRGLRGDMGNKLGGIFRWKSTDATAALIGEAKEFLRARGFTSPEITIPKARALSYLSFVSA